MYEKVGQVTLANHSLFETADILSTYLEFTTTVSGTDHWYIDDLRIGEHESPPDLGFPYEYLVPDSLIPDTWEPKGQWDIVDTGGYDDDYAWSLNPNDENQRNTDFVVELAGSVIVPMGAIRPELSYYDRLNIASDTTLTIEATTDDGLNWTSLTTFTSAYNRSDWILRRVSLDGYQGQTIRLRFRAIQGGAWTKDTWLFDNIRIDTRQTQTLSFPFEDLITDTLITDSWEPEGQWTIVDSGGSNDDYAWSLNPNDENQRNTDFAFMLGGVVVLPADATGLKLSYSDHFDLASDTTLTIEISMDDAQNWVVLDTFTSADNTADWTLRETALDAYAGQSVRVRFRAVQGSAWTQDMWKIDEIQITGELAAPTTTPTTTLTMTATPTATATVNATPTASVTLTPTVTATATPTVPVTPTPTPTTTVTTEMTPSVTPTPTTEGGAYNPGMGVLAMAVSYQPSVPGDQYSVDAEQAPVYHSASVTNTITYTYDALGRLTGANYNSGDYYSYTYDAVGNRLTMDSAQGGAVSYQYDSANRLSNAGGLAYSYDANGNLLSDGINTYVYDAANRLIAVNGQSSAATYAYNGLGDRHQQTVDGVSTNYTLDLNTGLTQVLADGTNTYLYGNGRISQTDSITEYFLGDALGSLRQLADATGEVTLTQSYAPYGNITHTVGTSQTSYGFTNEFTDPNGMVYLRARYYNPGDGRFINRDTWGGDYNRPLSLNRWGYVEGNPINFVDPTGFWITKDSIKDRQAVYSCNCGWIDFGHANPTLANGIHDTVKYTQRLSPPKNTLWYKYRQNLIVAYVSQPVKRSIPGTQIELKNIGFYANVSKNLTNKEQWEVTLSLLKSLSIIRESASWFGGGNSHFSEEDLTSDIIGFNLAYNGYGNPREEEASWQWLARKCGFSSDRETAKIQSLVVFEHYGDGKIIRKWHNPRLTANASIAEYLCNEGDSCPGKGAWPSEFTAFKPDTDNWSLYVPLREDFLAPSELANIYYSGYMPYMPWR